MGEQADEVAALVAAARRFNDGAFFEAHKLLEEAWRRMARGSRRRRLFQALIHLAAAALHHRDQRPRPAWLQYGRALDKLDDLPPRYHGMAVERLRGAAECAWHGLEGGRLTPPPVVRWSVELPDPPSDHPGQ